MRAFRFGVRGLGSVWLTALLVPSLAAAQETPATDPFSFDQGGKTPPIPIVLASGKVHVPVRIGASEPAWFVLDSGANATILDRGLAERLGLPLNGQTSGDQAAGGQRFQVWFSRVPSLRLPGLTIGERGVAVIERRTQGSNGHPSEGLLGGDLFRRLVVEVDYRAHTLTVHRAQDFRYRGTGTALPIRIDDNSKVHLDASLTLAGGATIEADLTVDTGSRGLLTLRRPFVERHDLARRFGPSAVAVVGFGVGGPVRHHLARLEAVKVGPFTLAAPVIDYPPADVAGAFASTASDGLLGASFLGRFRAIFDLPGERLILEPTTAPDVPVPEDASGLFLVAEGPAMDTVRALGVAPGSPADEAGMVAGDRLLAIDGEPLAGRSLDQVRDLLRQAGTSRRLAVERDGRTAVYTLTLRALI